jgi:ribosomal protein L22
MADEAKTPDGASDEETTEVVSSEQAAPETVEETTPDAVADAAESGEPDSVDEAAKPVSSADAESATSKKEPKADEPAKTESPATSAKQKPQAAKQPSRVVVRAKAKYVRTSARKARLVCDNIRGKSVDEARAILMLTPRGVSEDWSKLLESAVANAEHNHELDGEDLQIVAIKADEGPTLKRFRPRAQGRASAIRKRTAHLSIALAPKE